MSEGEVQGVEGAFAGKLGSFRLDAAFRIPPRGVTVLTGPSGSGKTTLLRCIAGLKRMPGRLTVNGVVWQDASTFLPAHRRPVGFVFQEASLLPHLSVRRNLTYGAHRAAKPHQTGFDEVVDLLGLAPLLARAPDRLSGGERQRVALGRALLSQPRLLLMDEPLSSLDAASKADILPYLERLHRALAIPAIYVTHDGSEARRLADHRLVMAAGRIVQVDEDVRTDEPSLSALSYQEVRDLALAALRAGIDPSA
jgi:molybdate transport system ATP-binding protein